MLFAPQPLRPSFLPHYHPDRHNVLSTESESDSECENVCYGLREVIPLCHPDQKSHADKHSDQKPCADKHSDQKPPAEKHSDQKPHADKHSDQKLHADKHSDQKPPADKHSDQKPHADKHSDQKPPADKHSDQKPHADKHSDQKPHADKHSDQKPLADKHSDQKPSAHRQKPLGQFKQQQPNKDKSHCLNNGDVLSAVTLLPSPSDLPKRLDASYLSGNQYTLSENPKLKKRAIPFNHRRIPMPGVHVSSLSEPGKQFCHMYGARPIQTQTASKAHLNPYQPPPPLKPPNESKPFPENQFTASVTPSMLGSSYVALSDPLQFVTRLPQKRSTPWSGIDCPKSSTKPPWRKIREDSVGSRKNRVPLRPKVCPNFALGSQFRSELTAVKPWLPPSCEVWSTDDEAEKRPKTITDPFCIPLPDSESDVTRDSVALTTSPNNSPSLACKEEKGPNPNPQNVLLDMKQSNVLEETSDVYSCMKSECRNDVNVHDLTFPGIDRIPNSAQFSTGGLVDGAPPTTEVWASDSEDDCQHADIVDKAYLSEPADETLSIQLSNFSQQTAESDNKPSHEEPALQHVVESLKCHSFSSTLNSLTSNRAINGTVDIFPPVTEVWTSQSEEEDKPVSQESNKLNTTESNAPFCEPWSTYSEEDGVRNRGSGECQKMNAKSTSHREGALYLSCQLWSSDSENEVNSKVNVFLC